MRAALSFSAQGDPDVAALAEILAEQEPGEATTSITGLEPEHPLYGRVRELIAQHGPGHHA
jgi:mannitol-1-phosphate 5-dehydrogenase